MWTWMLLQAVYFINDTRVDVGLQFMSHLSWLPQLFSWQMEKHKKIGHNEIKLQILQYRDIMKMLFVCTMEVKLKIFGEKYH